MMAYFQNSHDSGLRGRKNKRYGGTVPQPVGGSQRSATPKIHASTGPIATTGTETPKMATLIPR